MGEVLVVHGVVEFVLDEEPAVGVQGVLEIGPVPRVQPCETVLGAEVARGAHGEPREDDRDAAANRGGFGERGLLAHPEDRLLAIGRPGPDVSTVIEDPVVPGASTRLDTCLLYTSRCV